MANNTAFTNYTLPINVSKSIIWRVHVKRVQGDCEVDVDNQLSNNLVKLS